jgi:hypothetical protein
MKSAEKIKRLFKDAELRVHPDTDEKVFKDVLQACPEPGRRICRVGFSPPFARWWGKPHPTPGIWRITMRNPIAKIAIAAAILMAFGIGFSTGRWSRPTQLTPHTLDVTGSPSAVQVHSTTPKTEDSFWRQKALAAMQHRPYAQIQTAKTNLLNAYKQYQEKHHD